ncbi:Nucleoid-associated protein OS=Ureibacillus acetophenoni OX=614649 GN=SAMN05877842_1255 PE=3 SV=1 [Ureibacillus acetophenoni]|uniref:YbaB/EbfC family nucleoid-associated protein n=1 Tax=Ureibacillus sp. MALMAid1270 TaxID=3411629 RepID=UPI003BA404AD
MRGMGNMQGMMKKMQKMQKEMMQAQEELNAREFEGTAGGGMVKVTVNGQREVLGVNLDPSVVDPDDVEMLQDLVVVAINDALKKVEETTASTMGKFTQGLNLPF